METFDNFTGGGRRGLLDTERPMKKSPETLKSQDISSKTEKQNGVNKRRTTLTVAEAVETTLAARSFFNSGSGRKQELEKSRRRIRLEENIYKSWL